MSFTEPLYLLYLAISVGLNRLCPARFRPAFLLVTSYAFYSTWSFEAAGLLAVLTLATFGTVALMEKSREAGKTNLACMGPAAAIVLTVYLMAFKVALLTPAHGIAGLVMPLGISYYSFRLISYVLDVYWGKMPAEKGLVNFAAYVAFFPQMVAGPIQRPADFFGEMPPRPKELVQPVLRIALGLVKKLLIADNLAPLVNAVYGHASGFHGAPLWAAFYLFPLQLYADFSGLTDIAIGSGQLFGIRGPENFNRPLTATTVSAFWRRWHMSLTTWLTDYVFVPLRMSTRRAGVLGLNFSIAVNMVAIGLWHGLSDAFLVFGLINAVFLIVETLTSRKRAAFFKNNPEFDRPGTWLGWFVTFHLILIAEVFFRAPRVSNAVWLLGHLWTGLAGSGAQLLNLIDETGTRGLAIGMVGYLILEVGERYRPDLKVRELYAEAPRWVRWSYNSAGAAFGILGLALLLVYTAGKRSAFLYEIF